MSSALGMPSRHAYTLRKRKHPTSVYPITEDAAVSSAINVLPDHALHNNNDDIPTDCDLTSKRPRRGSRRPGRGLRRRLAGIGFPQPDATSASEARRKRISYTFEARQRRLRHRRESLPTQTDGDLASASDIMPVPSDNHASLLLALSEASVSHPNETHYPLVEEESKSREIGKELGTGPGGKRQETVVVGSLDHEIIKMDSQVLDCNICFEPLKPPIFKCEVGHVLCSLCHEKLPDRCVICCKRTSHSRCFALEQFIDAIRVPCLNTKYGCDEFITHDQKENHESACKYAACFCLEDGCSFIGSTGSLLDHFITKHRWSHTNLHYKKSLKISMARDHRFTLFVGEDMSMFLLTNTLTDIGNALNLVCISPHKSEPSYSSKISAVHRGAEERLVFQMDPLVPSSSLLGGVQLGEFFLLVPPDLIDESTDEFTINIRIDEVVPKSRQDVV